MALTNPRLAEIPETHVEAIVELVREVGITDASRISGLGRGALLSVIARGEATRGTAALVREFMARREAA